jgi:hypothetical protein
MTLYVQWNMKLEDRFNYDLICTVEHEIRGQS